jgi:lipoprotein-anchoring transpeptidase ErfK/SrfK
MPKKKPISRRDFLKTAALGIGGLSSGLAFRPWRKLFKLPDFPVYDRLGRVAFGKIEIKASPDAASETVDFLFEDAVVPWLREVVGVNANRFNQRWVETPDGYVWSPYLQPVRDLRQMPVHTLYDTSLGGGMWVEVSVPYVDIVLDNPPARAPWLQSAIEIGYPPRLYYSQILWVDQINIDGDDNVWYRINERYGFGDIFWAPAEAFRPVTQEEVAPISPDIEDKRVLVDVKRQTLSCYESDTEVYFCRISTGAKFNAAGQAVDNWATPLGGHRTWRKMISSHMVGGTTGGGYDLPGIGWTSLFVGSGVAIHSTFWHNDYGVPRSHGCINARPEDAKWVFRWIQPVVPYDPGDVTVSMPGGTIIEVHDG